MFDSNISGEQINSGWLDRLERDGTEKTAASTINFIRDRIREQSFADMVIPNQKVVRSDLQRSVNHDTLVKIIDIEPGSRAMPFNFRGQPDAQYINGKRYAISFFTISSLKFEIVEQELAAYEMPITKIIEQNSLKDMVEVKDREFVLHSEACVEAMQEEGNGGAAPFNRTNVESGAVTGVSKLKSELALQQTADDFVVKALQRPDVMQIKRLLKRNIVNPSTGEVVRNGRLRPAVMLATEADIDTIDAWTHEDMGDKLQSETAVNGWSYSKVLGLKVIRTIKSDILREGNIYVFTSADYLGRSYTYNDVKFYIDKQANRIFWQAWMDIGMGFGNVASIVKLELYAGSSISGAPDTGFEAARPVGVEGLGAQNNKVAEGLTFPHIETY